METVTVSFKPQFAATVDLPEHLDSPNTLLLAFASVDEGPAAAALQEVEKRFPNSVMVGCSTAGGILGDHVTDGTVVLSVVRFTKTAVRTAVAEVHYGEDDSLVGTRIGQTLDAADLSAVLVFGSGAIANGTLMAKGLQASVGDDVVVAGGLAAVDVNRWPETWLALGSEVRTNTALAVGFYGDAVQVGHGSFGGFDRFGPSRVITAAEGSLLLELDHKPALAIYREYLGDRAEALPGSALKFPLAIRRRSDDEDEVMRSIVAMDEERQGMQFFGDIPEGGTAQLMLGNLERVIEGSAESARRALKSTPKTPQFALAVSCVGRRAVLGERVSEEAEAVSDVLGPAVEVAGFYSFGEISPDQSGRAEFHNQTMTITTFAEA